MEIKEINLGMAYNGVHTDILCTELNFLVFQSGTNVHTPFLLLG